MSIRSRIKETFSRTRQTASRYFGRESKLGRGIRESKVSRVVDRTVYGKGGKPEVTIKETAPQKLEPKRVVDYGGKYTGEKRVRIYTDEKGVTWREETPVGGSITISGENAWDIPTGEVTRAYSAKQKGKEGYFIGQGEKTKFVEGTPPPKETLTTTKYGIGSLSFVNAQNQLAQAKQQQAQSGIMSNLFAGGGILSNKLFYQGSSMREVASQNIQQATGFGKFVIDTSEFAVSYPLTIMSYLGQQQVVGGQSPFKVEFVKVDFGKYTPTIRNIKEAPTTPEVFRSYGIGVGALTFASAYQISTTVSQLGYKQGLITTASQIFSPIQIKPGVGLYTPEAGYKAISTGVTTSSGEFQAGFIGGRGEYVYNLGGEKIGYSKLLYGVQSGSLKSGVSGVSYVAKQPYIQIGPGGQIFSGTATTKSTMAMINIGNIPTSTLVSPTIYGNVFSKGLPVTGINIKYPYVSGEAVSYIPKTSYGKMVISSPLTMEDVGIGLASVGRTPSGRTAFVVGKPFTTEGSLTGVQEVRYVSSKPPIFDIQQPSSSFGVSRRYYSGGDLIQAYKQSVQTREGILGQVGRTIGSIVVPSGFLPTATATTPIFIPSTTTRVTQRVSPGVSTISSFFQPTSTLIKIGGGSATGVSTGLAQITPTITITTETTTPTTTTPGFPGITTTFTPFFFPKFFAGFQTGARTRNIKRKKPRRKYTPSYEALIFGIKGKQPKYITGLEVRPIPKGFKWSY